MFLKMQKRTLSFLLALILVLSTFMSVAVFPASAEGEANYGVRTVDQTAAEEKTYATLTAAINSIDTEHEWIITVLRDVLYDEHCTIPGNATLLVPCDAEHTVNATIDVQNSQFDVQTVYDYTTPSSFCTMEMAANSTLTVADGGAICVNSKLASIGAVSDDNNNWNGAPTGANGRIMMHSNSTITLNSGAELYVWGYIHAADYARNDEGKVEALSGSTVYEAFQIKNYRGLNESMAAVRNGAFPFNQYYVQNIEVPLYAYPGANEMGIAALHNTGSGIYVCPVSFIGETGLFRLTDADAYLIKDYIEEEDRLSVQIYGDSQLSSIQLSLYGVNLDSSAFPLPITNNIKVEVVEGNTEINQTITMLPGTELVVDEGASMTVEEGTTVYVYDADQWESSYVGAASGSYVGVGYTAANGTDTDTYRQTPEDATIDINGEVVVHGAVYATGNADISSSAGTGSIVFNTSAGSTPAAAPVECDADGNTQQAAFGAISLRYEDENGDDRYVSTADDSGGLAHAKYVYDGDNNTIDTLLSSTVYFYDMEEEDEPLAEVACSVGDRPVYTGTTPSGFTGKSTDKFSVIRNFIGWSTEPDSNVAEYPAGTDLPICEGEDLVQYYAAYDADEKSYTVQWLDLDGGVLYSTDEPVLYSEIDKDACTLVPPSKDGTPSGNYYKGSVGYSFSADKARKTVTEFTGWQEYPEYGENVASFTPDSKKETYYLLLFLNEGKTEALAEVYAKNGSSVNPCEIYTGTEPTKDSDEEGYAYSFSGWQSFNQDGSLGTVYSADGTGTLKVANPSGSSSTSLTSANKQTFVPVFEKKRVHTITWNDENGELISTTEVADGETPVPPEYTKPSDNRYDYTTTWPEIASATEDATYQAIVTASPEKSYTVVWIDKDGSEKMTKENVLYSKINSSDCPAPTATITHSGYFPEGTLGYEVYKETVNRYETHYSWQQKEHWVFDAEARTCTIRTSSSNFNYTTILFLNADATEVVYADTDIRPGMSGAYYVKGYSNPTKASDLTYFYTHNGKWKNENGTVLSRYDTYSSTWSSSADGAKKNVWIPQFDKTPFFSKHSLTLDGTIGVNFYVELPDGYDETNTEMDFSWGHQFISTNTYSEGENYETYTYTDKTGTAKDGLVEFTVPVAPKEINDEITAVLKDKNTGEVIARETYRGTDYAKTLLNKTDDELTELAKEGKSGAQLRAAVNSMLNYCALAQQNFNYIYEPIVASEYDFEGKNDFSNYALNYTYTPNDSDKFTIEDAAPYGLKEYLGIALNLGSETSYALQFRREVGADPAVSAKFAGGDALEVEKTYSSNIVFIRYDVKNLPAPRAFDDIELTIGGKTATINAKNYLYLVDKNTSADSTLNKTCRALYDYSQCAAAYLL